MTEQWHVDVLDGAGNVLKDANGHDIDIDSPIGVDGQSPGSLDSLPWIFGFRGLPDGVGAVRLTFNGTKPDGVGLAFNNFSATTVSASSSPSRRAWRSSASACSACSPAAGRAAGRGESPAGPVAAVQPTARPSRTTRFILASPSRATARGSRDQ